ncbi:MAG: hypothetical protein R3B35_15145 [Gemmatimonadales bacterium]
MTRLALLGALALATALGVPHALMGQFWHATSCTADPVPDVRIACAFEVAGIPRLSDPEALGYGPARADRELRFWTVTAWTIPTIVARVWQHGDSVHGQALMIVSVDEDTVSAFRRLCGRSWIRHDAKICEMRRSGAIDWGAFLDRVDAAGVVEMPSQPVRRAPCGRTRFVDSTGTPEILCAVVADGDSEGLEYRTGSVYWKYLFESIPDTSSPGLARDEAIQRAWDCVRRRLFDGGCRPPFVDEVPSLRWVTRRPVSREWRPTVGLLAFGADSLVRTALPEGVREWRIQLDCLGCTPGVVLRIIEDSTGIVRGVAYLLTGRDEAPVAGAASEAYAAHLDTLRTAVSCGPAVRLGWRDLEACEVALPLDWARVLHVVRESGILEDLDEHGRMVDPPFQEGVPTPRIEVVPFAGARMVIGHDPGPCTAAREQELIIEKLDGVHYRAGSFGCLQVARDTSSAHDRRAALYAWLAQALPVGLAR